MIPVPWMVLFQFSFVKVQGAANGIFLTGDGWRIAFTRQILPSLSRSATIADSIPAPLVRWTHPARQ